MNTRRNPGRRLPHGFAVLVGCLFITACGKTSRDHDPSDASSSTRGAFVQIDADTTAEERRYLEFGREVFERLCARDFAAFHAHLSSQGNARLSLNQFAPADDDAVFARQEAQPRQNVALPEFLQLMATMEQRFGLPTQPLDLHVHATDPAVLAGQQREPLDALEVMFAIGNMPDLIPAAQRKASLRGQIGVTLTPAQLADAAKAMEMTPEELAGDPDFEPYLNLKLVIVEEDGALRIGYFEFLPPSMFD